MACPFPRRLEERRLAREASVRRDRSVMVLTYGGVRSRQHSHEYHASAPRSMVPE